MKFYFSRRRFGLLALGAIVFSSVPAAESSAPAASAPSAVTSPAASSAASSVTPTPSSAIVPGVVKSDYGQMPDGATVELYTLTNKNGAVAKIITYGATIIELDEPDRAGKFANVVLSTNSLDSYLRFPDPASVMGRVANRIAGARFTLDGHDYTLFANDGPNTLHGGKIGFSKVVWKGEIIPAGKDADPAVKLTYISKDGDEGFPGTLTASVTYTLTAQNTLRLEYSASTDKPTPVNLTNHAFWNLAGGTGDSNAYLLTLNADRTTLADAALIPTGEIAPVKGTPLDFTQPTALGARAADLPARHYDHSFVLNRPADAGSVLTLAARVVEPTSGRIMEVWTNQPGLQLYTSQLGAARGGRGGRGAGFLVLETQHFPDAVHHDNFPSIILRPGETFSSETEYRFSAK